MKNRTLLMVIILVVGSFSVFADTLHSSHGVIPPAGNVIQGVPGFDYANFSIASICPVGWDMLLENIHSYHCTESDSGLSFASWEIIDLGSLRSVFTITLDHACPQPCNPEKGLPTGTRIFYTTTNPSHPLLLPNWVYLGTTTAPTVPDIIYRDIFSFTPRNIRAILIGSERIYFGAEYKDRLRPAWYELTATS